MEEKKARLNFYCSLEERRLLRMLAAKEDKSISQYLLGLIRREIKTNGIQTVYTDIQHAGNTAILQ
jgi:hypothetical protein